MDWIFLGFKKEVAVFLPNSYVWVNFKIQITNKWLFSNAIIMFLRHYLLPI